MITPERLDYAKKILEVMARHFPVDSWPEIVYEDLLDAETLETQVVPLDKLLEADLTE